MKKHPLNKLRTSMPSMESQWLIALMVLSKSVKSKHMLLFMFSLLFFSIELSAQTVTQACDFDLRSQTNPSAVSGDGDTAGSLAALGASPQVVLIANGTNLPVGDGGISGVQLDNAINLSFRVFNSDFDGLDDNGDPIDETFTIQLDNFSYSISSYGNNTKQITVSANDATAMLADGEIEVRYTNFGAGWSGADNGDNEFSIEFLNSNNIDYSYTIDTTTVNICLAAGPLDLGAYISGQTANSAKAKFLEVARNFPLQGNRFFDPTATDDLGYYRMKHEFVCNDEAAVYNEFKNVFVYAVPNATLVDDFVFNEGCSKEFGGLNLKELFTSSTNEGGVFSLTDSNQGNISSSGVFTPTDGFSGCVELTYTLDNPGNCTLSQGSIETYTTEFFVSQKLNPAFEAPTSITCWDGISPETIDIINTGFSSNNLPSNASINWSIDDVNLNTSLVTSGNNAQVIINSLDDPLQTKGSVTICLEETISYTDALPVSDCIDSNLDCTAQICKTIEIFKQNCNDDCLLYTDINQCPIESNPTFSFQIFGQSLPITPGIDVVVAKVETDLNEISCEESEIDNVEWDYQLNLDWLDDVPGITEPLVSNIDALDDLCDVATFSIEYPVGLCDGCGGICLDLGLTEPCIETEEWEPFNFLNFEVPGTNISVCNASIKNLIIEPIQEIVEQTAIGVVWADTDGDGAFDYELSSGNLIFDGSASGSANVPNNVEGEGFIVIRNNTASVIAPYSPCVSPDEQSFFDLLPIDFIPVAGPIIRQALTTAGIDFNIALSAHKDLSIRVINDQDPIFLNLPTELVFHTNQFCDPVQWTDPIAIDGCTGAIIDNVTQTGGPSPGSILAVGSHIVEYTATACNNQSIVQEMEIIIVEGTPDLVCPPNFSIRTDADNCSKYVTGIAPLEGLGCNTVITWESVNQSGASQTGTGDASGTLFPLDDNTVSYNLLHTDDNGQQSSASCTFTITVIDEEKPTAVCQDIEVQLNENGAALVSKDQLNGGSFDNCTPSNILDIQINRSGEPQTDVVSFSCEDKGNNTVVLSVVDQAFNERRCLANVVVRDYFQDVIINFDAPEICLEANNPEQLDFNNYLTIGYPNGAITTAYDEFIDGDEIAGVFSIAGFLPSPGSASSDPGSINPITGVFTPGEGTGFVTIAYVLGISDQVSVSSANLLEGCYVMVHETFELRQPLEMEEPECVCGDFTNRYVDLGIVEGGLEPYTIQYTGATLDLDEDFDTDDSDGSYTYSATDNHDITDFQQDLGQLKVDYNTPVWSITIVDARGCEIFRSGSCDNDDATEAPSITCPADIGVVFTDEYVCTSFQEWLHPDILSGFLYDNCFVRQYNYYVENADGTVEGPFDLMPLVNIEDDGSTNVDPSLFEASHNFQKGVSTVFYYAADAVGNFIDCSFSVTVEDNLPPTFINCPYPPVVENAETDHCDAYVNFALPLAEDNCDVPTVTQIDDTGLTTGDRFPVGMTIMYWEAIDDSDNRDTCQVKVIVNDYWNVPEIVCPEDVLQTTDEWRCDAEVYNINPEITSICQDNLSVFYEIFSDAALTNRIECGVWDASGETFDKGDSWVRYTVESQPLLLISEISQSAGTDQLEIVNLGPAAMDISCLEVVRTAQDAAFTETLPMVSMLPSLAPTVLGVGEVMVFDFSADAAADMPACYLIQFMGSVIDQVAVNNYATPCAGFTGTLDSGDVYRHCEADTDAAADWVAAENCSPLTIGQLNPDLEAMPDNGTLASLQSEPASSASCVFQVTIIDDEDPFCGELATAPNNYVGPAINNISETTCNRSEIEILDGCIIGSLDFNLSGNVTPADASITLISPEGVEVDITTLPASPFDYYTFKSEGIWTLDIEPNPGVTGLVVNSWTLDITCMLPYTMDDTVLPNDADLCGAQFDWTHPWFVDNCVEGTITVEYLSADADCVPTGGLLTDFGGYDVSEFFCVGTTTVLYTLVDEAGNDHQCSFDVTVEDVQDPVVVCPDDIIIQLDGGECRRLVCFEPLSATDNCAVVDTSYSVEPCTEFEIGITPVTITIFDEAGNSDECTFDIEIIEYVPSPYILICNDLVNVSLGADCSEEITADMILEGNNYHCYEDYIITISENNVPLATSPEVTINDVGGTYTVMVLDPDSGNTCWGEINIEDFNIPQLECPVDITVNCHESTEEDFTGSALLSSCEASVEWFSSDYLEDYGECSTVRSEITRTWTVVDESGNTNNCVQTITIERLQLEDIQFPDNYDGTINPIISCTDLNDNPSLTDPINTGMPVAFGMDFGSSSLCGLSTVMTDQIFSICGGSYDILRTWTVYDPCLPAQIGTNPRQYVQTIKVRDQIAPSVVCPEDITISVDAINSCTATHIIPEAIIDDACSSYTVITTTPYGSLDSNGGEVSGLPRGTFDIKYQIVDDCNNISNCEYKLTIIDAVTPDVICLEFTEVVLNSDGQAQATYEQFDNGTHDNCCLSHFEVARMDEGIFGETIDFNCNDDELMVIMRAFDCYDNFSDCMVTVHVEDKLSPITVCPADITIDCNAYAADYAALLDAASLEMQNNPDLTTQEAFDFLYEDFNDVTAFDNCALDLAHSVDYNVDQCGEGTITRTWTATDPSANQSAPCTQTITVVHESDWNINFPEDWSGELEADCSVPDIGYGEAVVSDDECEMIAVNYSDEVYNVTIDACYKIVRTFTAINWCTYDAITSTEDFTVISAADHVYNVSGNSYVTHAQILEIYDTTEPDVETIEDLTVGIFTDCTTGFTLPEPVVLNECSGYTVTVNSPELAAYGSAMQYANVEAGTYFVSYQIMDDCGNSTFINYDVIVRDEKAPTAFCTDELVIELMPDGNGGGMAQINAADFNVGSFDNCTAENALSFSFSSDINETTADFDCSHVAELQLINMYVWDAEGNSDYCIVSLDVQDNNAACDLGSLTLSGAAATENDFAVENVAVELNGGTFSSMTDINGEFSFGGLTPGGDYSVSAVLDANPTAGVTTFDIVLITQHILGMNSLGSPYKMIAADANNSGSVTTLDIVSIRKLILTIDQNFQNNTSWRFVDADYTFADPTDPWSGGFPEVVNFNNLTEDALANFVAIKVGDVNGSAETSNLLGSQNRNLQETMTLKVEDITLTKNQPYSVEFNSDATISGCQFTIAFNSELISFTGLENALLGEEHFGLVQADNGLITVSWNKEKAISLKENKLFALNFTANKDLRLSEAITINSTATKAEAYDLNNNIIDVELDIQGQKTQDIAALYQNVPNPFKGQTSIAFYLPQAADASISIRDINGKLVQQLEGSYEAGYNSIRIANLPAGVLYYTLEADDFTETKKMIKL